MGIFSKQKQKQFPSITSCTFIRFKEQSGPSVSDVRIHRVIFFRQLILRRRTENKGEGEQNRDSFTGSHLRRDDLDRCHEAVGDDGHSQEHVHERHKVDHSSGNLVTDPRAVGLPDGQQDAGPAHRRLLTLLLSAQRSAIANGHGGRGGGGEHRGRDPSQVGVGAGLTALGLWLTRRQLMEEEEEEVEDGGGGFEERHGDTRGGE